MHWPILKYDFNVEFCAGETVGGTNNVNNPGYSKGGSGAVLFSHLIEYFY